MLLAEGYPPSSAAMAPVETLEGAGSNPVEGNFSSGKNYLGWSSYKEDPDSSLLLGG